MAKKKAETLKGWAIINATDETGIAWPYVHRLYRSRAEARRRKSRLYAPDLYRVKRVEITVREVE